MFTLRNQFDKSSQYSKCSISLIKFTSCMSFGVWRFFYKWIHLKCLWNFAKPKVMYVLYDNCHWELRFRQGKSYRTFNHLPLLLLWELPSLFVLNLMYTTLAKTTMTATEIDFTFHWKNIAFSKLFCFVLKFWAPQSILSNLLKIFPLTASTYDSMASSVFIWISNAPFPLL